MKTKKLLTVLIAMCMVLSMLPIATFAAEPATETADFTVSDSGAAAIDLLNRYKSFGAADSTWDNGTKTLTLRGIDFTTKAATAVKLPDRTTIVLADGTYNTIQSGDVSIDVSGSYKNTTYINALAATGNLTVQSETAGTGTLSVCAGSVKNSGDGWTFSSGINVCGDLTVKGGQITAQGGYIEGYDSCFSIGVNMDNDIKNKALLVTGGTLTAVAGEAYELEEGGTKRAMFSRGIYMYRGNISVSGNGKLFAESVSSMSDGGVLSNGLYISVGNLFVSNNAEVKVSGAYGAYISGGEIRLDGGKLTAASTQTESTYGNAIDTEVNSRTGTANAGSITVNGGTLETENGQIYMSTYGATETQGIFTVTDGTVLNKGQLSGAKRINISGGSVQTQGIDVKAMTLSGGNLTVREPVRKSSYNGKLYAFPAVDVRNLTVSGGTLDAAWDWGEYTPIVLPKDEEYNDVGILMRIPYDTDTASFTGGTTILDTGFAGNTAILNKGQLILGDGMAETGADAEHRQLGNEPVKIAAVTISTITTATIENAKFNYQPGDAPQATAEVYNADADKYEIAYECWQEFENNEPVAAWYSDNGSHGSLPTFTEFESGKKYVYSLMLMPKDGYSFTGETVITVNEQKVSAPFVGGSMYIPSVKTITMPTVTVIDVVEINNVTVSFKDGDKPVFTGKVPDGAAYAFRCEWWELDSKTGAMSTDFGNFYENKITAFEAGKTYHYGVYVTTYGDVGNIQYIFSPDTKLKINGEFVNYTRYEGDESDGSDGTMWVLTDLAMTIISEYKITEGTNGVWTQNSNDTLTFRANGDFSKFTGIKVDGITVPADKYTAASGSTVITLKKAYLGTLSVGKHTLSVVYSDGECGTEFEIKAAPHSHSYGTEWKYDGTSHWHECICGDKADTAAHTFEWVTDKEPTDDEKGSKHEECTVCHATRNEHTEIPATGEDCLFTKICKFIIKIITKFVLWILDFINGIC